jgi:hypothetical protein
MHPVAVSILQSGNAPASNWSRSSESLGISLLSPRIMASASGCMLIFGPTFGLPGRVESVLDRHLEKGFVFQSF